MGWVYDLLVENGREKKDWLEKENKKKIKILLEKYFYLFLFT